ncbi:MAG: GNAT family N-acetyltransferase [Ruminococcaceae bacterium]|nr:GNAT family N-acetyltransferase [Oscillospiraceae bacterium]
MLTFKLRQGEEGYQTTKQLREQVFMTEQGFSYDRDDTDAIAWHIAGYDGDVLIAAGRLFPIADGVFGIGRVAVAPEYRRQYVGDTVMRALEDKAVKLCAIEIRLNAQEQAVGFYQTQGYTPCGELYTEEGCPHLPMRKDLTKPIHRCADCAKKKSEQQ